MTSKHLQHLSGAEKGPMVSYSTGVTCGIPKACIASPQKGTLGTCMDLMAGSCEKSVRVSTRYGTHPFSNGHPVEDGNPSSLRDFRWVLWYLVVPRSRSPLTILVPLPYTE